MRELKPAIEYFKDAIKESDEIIEECSDDLKTELTKQKRHFIVAVAAMEKREPKKVIKIPGKSSQACPVCGFNVCWNYCPNCGQRMHYA